MLLNPESKEKVCDQIWNDDEINNENKKNSVRNN